MSSATSPGAPRESERRAIRELIHGMYEAFAAHDSAGVDAALDEDCTVWDVFTPRLVRGRREREEFHAADQAQSRARGRLTWSLSEPLIDAWGDTAVARYELSFAYEPPNPAAGHVRITDVLRRSRGRWSIVHHHEGLVPDGIPPIDPPPRAGGQVLV